MQKTIPIAVSYGDGIGPEIMQATLKILQAAGADIEINKVEIGEEVYLQGNIDGIEPLAWHILKSTKAFLKAPNITPRGSGFNKISSTIRAALGLYANIRPCISYHPFIKTRFPYMNLVIIKGNEEDIANCIEYQQTPNMCHSLKMASKEGSEKIMRFAFEYAIANNRKKVSCFTKEHLMKFTDGLYHHVFQEIAKEYPSIENEHLHMSTGCAKLIGTPEAFDCIVLPSFYADVLAEIGTQIAGSKAFGYSINISEEGAMFETTHGAAPEIAFQNIANPSGLIFAAIQMLVHINQQEAASLINNAWLKTIEDGIHTFDVYSSEFTKQKVGTKEFANAIIQRLGQKPSVLQPITFDQKPQKPYKNHLLFIKRRELVGCDFYIYHRIDREEIIKILQSYETQNLKLVKVSNRGAMVFPEFHESTNFTEQWGCRFLSEEGVISHQDIVSLYQNLIEKLEVIHTENLYSLNDEPGYSV